MSRLLSALPLVLAMALPFAAKADTVSLTLATPMEFGRPGTTLNYIGTISAPSTNTGNEYLNGDSFNVSAPLTLDDSGFFNNAPLFLVPGTSYTGVLFDLIIPAGASGIYIGSYSILGGANGNASNVLGTASFQANVTPEPSSLVLLGTGLLSVVGTARRKYRRS